MKKAIKTKSKAGGQAITEDEYYTELVDYEKSKTTNTKEATTSKQSKQNKSNDKSNDMNVGISTTMYNPVPSTSGVRNTNHSPRQVLSEDSEIESDVNDEEYVVYVERSHHQS
jgi:hypothetical protein